MMSSPVEIWFSSFIKIDRSKEDPVYLQMVYQVINAVKMKLLEDGDQIPGTRKIAEDLKVHRRTVVAAIEELKTQGWIETKPGIGTYVRNPEKESSNHIGGYLSPPEQAAFSFRKNFILDPPARDMRQSDLEFTDGTPDFRIIKSRELVRFYGSVLRRRPKSFSFSRPDKGNPYFKEQLTYYLNLTRKLHISRAYLLPVSNREQVFSILSQLLVRPGEVVLVAEWSFYLANMIFGQAGADLRTVPLDTEGIQIDFIEETYRKGEIKFLYLNTRCQYPTTVSLSPERREKLMQVAEKYDFLIVEDDSEAEFSYEKKKTEPLFKQYGGNRVVYLGQFGRFLMPGFSRYFMIGPKDFIAEGRKYRALLGRPDVLMEQALGEMIRQGDIHRYRRKARRAYKARRTLFDHLLAHYFDRQINYSPPAAGLAFWLALVPGISLTALQREAGKKGLLINRLSLYQNKDEAALRVGFANLNEAEMERAMEIFHAVFQNLQDENGRTKDLLRFP